MVNLPLVPIGCCVIPLYRNISGDNFHPIYEIIDYTVVDDVDFLRLNQHRWIMYESSTGDRYAYRKEGQGSKTVNIYMAREILNLPRGAGYGGDEAEHKDNNTLNNRRENLRIATRSQNNANRRRYRSSQRFKGIHPSGNKYRACVVFSRLIIWFTTVEIEVEAAKMYNYAAIILYDEFAELNVIPEDEMPSRERCWELLGMVVEKLRVFGYT